MYRLEDERAAIREIQKYLYFISDSIYPEIPRVAIDGIYGEETREAVRVFQRIVGLDENGNVDYETFTMLYAEYLNAQLLIESEKFFIDTKIFPVKEGDMGREILYINLMLDELGKIYSEMGRVDIKPYFTQSSENAVKELRKIFMLESSPVIDLLLFNKMRHELKVRGGENNYSELF